MQLKTWMPVLACVTLLSASAGALDLSSPDIKPGTPVANKHVFSGFGCKGDNVSPALAWAKAPKGTKSFAVLVHDPDAPTGGAGWWHWLIYNIPATANGLAQGAGKSDGSKAPAGAAQWATDFGKPGWGGPCPPPGPAHRYVFTVYALKVEKLEPPKGATASLLGFLVNDAALAKASLTVTYGRKK